jgi:N-acetylglucosamine-6-phosphate deacetylase
MTRQGQHAIAASRVFTGTEMLRDRVVVIEAGSIAAVLPQPPEAMPCVRLAEDRLLAPGFVDLQVNGGGGVLFNDSIDAAGFGRIAAAHRSRGTTSILPTLISGARVQLRQAMATAATAIAAGLPGIVGLHLEGPFLNPLRRGIHPAETIIALTDSDLAWLAGVFPAPLLLTLAPEMVPLAAIARLAAAGRIVFAGHTEASAEQALAALDAGMTGFTHLFNAMSQLSARAPGAVGAALAHPTARAGIILDGHHVHPAAARAAFAAMGPERLFLVSDAMPTAGSSIEAFQLGATRIRLLGGRLVDAAGTLAGAHLTLDAAVRNAVRLLGCPVADALRMATSTPSISIGLGDTIGHIRPGCRADLVALDGDLHPVAVWISGARMAD